MKKRTYTESEQRADLLLGMIRIELDAVEDISKMAEVKIASLNEQLGAQLTPHQEALASLEQELTALMKEEKAVFFEDADVVNLLSGSLIHGEKIELRIPKTAVEWAEAEHLFEAIKVAKSIDRGLVETWPDEMLARIGAKRKTKETFGYEVKGKETGDRSKEKGEGENETRDM